LITALGLMPPEGVSAEVKDDLRRLSLGASAAGMRLDAHDRSHALTAVVRQRADGWLGALQRTLTAKRMPAPVRRAALLAAGAAADDLLLEERAAVLRGVEQSMDRAHDPFTRGLAYLAIGRLVRADLEAGSTTLLLDGGTDEALVRNARNASTPSRGFAALALGLAAGAAAGHDGAAVAAFRASSQKELLHHLEHCGDPALRGAYVVALGLSFPRGGAPEEVVTALEARLLDRGESPGVRAHAALAIALGCGDAERAARAIGPALGANSDAMLQAEAAVALSYLGGRPETRRLLDALPAARSQHATAQIVTALGRLGDPTATEALLAVARDPGRGAETRALAIAAIGILFDPEPRPSLRLVSVDANYPARTDALQEAFTIF
jgi:hypothetical protein